jgi:hypothetical protein
MAKVVPKYCSSAGREPEVAISGDGKPRNSVATAEMAPTSGFARTYLPRVELVVLACAFVVTILAKLVAVRAYQPASLLSWWVSVAVGDVAFFAVVAAAAALAYAVLPRRWLARIVLLAAVSILGWSLANAAWLCVTGVQLQPGVIFVILKHPAEFWPTVSPHLKLTPLPVLLGAGLAGLAGLAWVGWRLIRPRPISKHRRRYVLGGVAGILVALVVLTVVKDAAPEVGMGSVGPVLSYSSHGHVLTSLLPGQRDRDVGDIPTRVVPRVGERQIEFPTPPPAGWPNIVLVLLESVSYRASGLGETSQGAMPTLSRLAAEGVEFTHTRVPVSQTGKAFWATLTGTTPDLYHDYAEAILVDEPYESLASLLSRVGYRSAFFQMSKGTFECAPGTFANLAFDWAWFRENLEDPSANLGYLSGDDFRMLDPALEWATDADSPFLLMMITSVAHDPYDVPESFGPRLADQRARYHQAVRYTDAFLAELLERLAERGLAENTLLCVLGDHGESFRPESRHTRWVPFEEVVRVPWVLSWPGHIPAGQRCSWPCSQLDVTPTILSVLGCDISASGFDGRDALTPGDPERRLPCASWYQGSPLALVEGTRKWLYWPRTGEVQFYDLAGDPDELSPITVDDTQRARVAEFLTSWQRSSYIEFHARRFRRQFLYDHWWAFSSGRYGRAYYVP